jgi:hypothetical protein
MEEEQQQPVDMDVGDDDEEIDVLLAEVSRARLIKLFFFHPLILIG